jgi:hypothetical protein
MAAVAHHLFLGGTNMTTTIRPVVNRDREEIRVPSPFGGPLLSHLSRRGLRGSIRTDRAGDVVTLLGEPDMGRVIAVVNEFKIDLEPAGTSA